MARIYLRVEAALPRHPKVVKLVEALGVPDEPGADLAVAFLLRWWSYCAEFGSDGKPAECPRTVLQGYAKSLIGASRLTVVPDVAETLQAVRLMDKHGRPWDWQDYTGLLLKKRAADAERKRKGRGQAADVTPIVVQGSTVQLQEGALARSDTTPAPDIKPRKVHPTVSERAAALTPIAESLSAWGMDSPPGGTAA